MATGKPPREAPAAAPEARRIRRDYGWTRFLSLRSGDQPLFDEAGFLVHPGAVPAWGGAPPARPLDEWVASPCVVVLGEPGIGKSRVLGEHAEQRARAGSLVRSPDLGEYGAEQTFLDGTFHAQWYREWLAGEGTLELVLDGLDELRQRIPHIARILTARLRDSQAERLRLRVSCRAAQWPDTLAPVLQELWSGYEGTRVLQLLPLRRSDVAVAAQQRGIDAEAFREALRNRGVEPLATVPGTLDLLLDVYEAQADLPEDRVDLYRQAMRLLSKEPPERRDNAPRPPFDEDHLVAVSERIAASLLLSGNPSVGPGAGTPDRISMARLAGGAERADGRDVNVTSEAVDLALRTGLFQWPGADSARFAHNTYAEFLAASFLLRNRFAPSQLRRVLGVPGTRSLTVAPHLYGLAAWAANMDTATFDLLLRTQPHVLIGSDLTGSRAQARAKILEAYLSAIDKGSVRPPSVLEKRLPLHNLRGVDSHKHLRKWVVDRSRSITARRVAIEAAESCRATELSGELASLALDDREEHGLRVEAAFAVARIGGEQAKSRLKSLAAGIEADLDDQLKGLALQVLWPTHLTATELFEYLTPRKKHNFFGAYTHFLYGADVAPHLDDAGLVAGLTWLETCVRRGEQRGREDLGSKIMQRALERHSQKTVLDALTDVVLASFAQHSDLMPSSPGLGEEAPDDPFADADARRAVLRNAVPRLGEQRGFRFWARSLASSSAALVRPDDFTWLIERCLGSGGIEREQWSSLASTVFAPEEESHWAALLNADASDAQARQWLPLPRAIELDSPLAQRLRFGAGPPAIMAVAQGGPARCEAKTLAMIDRALELAAPDERWAGALTLLRGHNVVLDVTSRPCWTEATEAQRQAIVAAARLFVEQVEPSPDQVSTAIQDGAQHYPLWAGYPALALVAREDPECMDTLAADRWQAWGPVLMLAFGHESDADREVWRLLLRAAYSSRPKVLVDTLLQGLSGRDPHLGLEAAGYFWDDALSTTLFIHLKEGRIPAPTVGLVLGRLLEREVEGAVDEARVLTKRHARGGDDRIASIGAARSLLSHDPRAGWDVIERILAKDTEWGKAVVFGGREFTDSPARRLGQLLPEATLGRAVAWHIQVAPYEEDAEDSFNDASMQRDDLLESLKSRGTEAAVQALRSLARKFPRYHWLSRATLEAEELRQKAEWAPTAPERLIDMASHSRDVPAWAPSDRASVVIGALTLPALLLLGPLPTLSGLVAAATRVAWWFSTGTFDTASRAWELGVRWPVMKVGLGSIAIAWLVGAGAWFVQKPAPQTESKPEILLDSKPPAPGDLPGASPVPSITSEELPPTVTPLAEGIAQDAVPQNREPQVTPEPTPETTSELPGLPPSEVSR